MMNKYFDKNRAGFCSADPMLYGVLKEHAKYMRSVPTCAEKLLWQQLNQGKMGKPFRRQHIIMDNIVDFVCLPCKLIIEVDGGYHNEIHQKHHDELRTEELERCGFRVIRFTNEEVYNSIDSILEKIKSYLI